MVEPARVLVVDDDRSIRDAITRALSLEGYSVLDAKDGADALAVLATTQVDVVVLDLMMPNADGMSVCRRLRSRGDRVPVLMLTARTAVSDRVSGLDAGADDYLPKPFDLDELLARVRALLRRTRPDPAAVDARFTVGDLVIDEAARRAWRAERELELTRTEFDLLLLLVRNAGIVLTHSQIYDEIWEDDFGPESKALAVYIGYLRRKVEEDDRPRLIHTVRGVGYTVRPPQ